MKSALEKGTHSKKEVRLRVIRRKGSMKRIADVIEGVCIVGRTMFTRESSVPIGPSSFLTIFCRPEEKITG